MAKWKLQVLKGDVFKNKHTHTHILVLCLSRSDRSAFLVSRAKQSHSMCWYKAFKVAGAAAWYR